MRAIKCTPFLALLAMLAGCTKPQADAPPASLEGEWQWVQSDGGLANNIHDTPASTGKSITLKLTGGGEFTYYTNGTATAQGTYTLETRTCIHNQKEKTLINFSNCPNLMVESWSATTLELSDEAFDGVSSLYQKAEEAAR